MFETAFAQGTSSAAAPSLTSLFVPFLLILPIMYFLVIRPQQRQVKAHRAMLDAIKRGDTVVTGGGLIGKVSKIEDAEMEIELSPNVKVRLLKSSVVDVRTRGEPANDTAKK